MINYVCMARYRSPLTVTTSFGKWPNYESGPNSHQTVTRFWCVGCSMYAWGFSVPQMWQFCLFTYPPRSKWDSYEKSIFFFAKIGIFCKSIAGPLSKGLLGGRIKLIICQISYELSVTIHEISTSWKKTLDRGPNIATHLFTNNNLLIATVKQLTVLG